MLDLFSVFTKSGLVLWCFQDPIVKLKENPLNQLIRQVLIEQRGGETEHFLYNGRALEYTLDNTHDLVFAAAYPENLQKQLDHIGTLLQELKESFIEKFGEQVTENPYRNFDFAQDFKQIRLRVEAESREKKKNIVKRAPKDFTKSSKYEQTKEFNERLQAGEKPREEMMQEVAVESKQEKVEDEEDAAAKKRREFIEKQKNKKSPTKSPTKNKKPDKPKGKKDQPEEKGSGKLDYTDGGADTSANFDDALLSSGGSTLADYDVKKKPDKSASSGVFSFFKTLSGAGAMTSEALEPALTKMREHLVAKNVASDIAEKICNAVGENLLGKSKGTFQSISSIVQESVEAALTKILSPKRRIDILRDVMSSKQKNTPYVITFCGVNGVGKSTNLSKVTFWLLQNGFSVCIAACDTFRAGAVEQLRTHKRRLNAVQEKMNLSSQVELYHQGYGKDPAAIARDAIAYAKSNSFDVVLIDTAGRMQDNAPLMAALAKLVTVNNPDLVLFVGEALVGNEAVDQLVKFNQALADHSDAKNPHLIDGIVLTKFDTIDDKVGAAISMTYTTGQPILFVGTGQSYNDLKKLNVNSVVSALLA
eukprot:m.113135 g.113135  ORF g.113135 m.113135 type:complete len:591 (-) comp14121_c0_seq2:966-2738(-)